MKIRSNSQSRTASALIAVIITITILCLVAGSFVVNVNNRRMTLSQASAWQEALAAAEAGVHQGIAQLEQGLAQNSLPLAGPPNSIDWSQFPSGTARSVPSTRVYLNHGGEGPSGPSNSYADYTLTLNEYPPPSPTPSPPSPTPTSTVTPRKPYYCIVSTGTVGIPGGKSLSRDSADAVLRKLNLNPQTGTRTATRTIEAWVRPVYTTQTALETDQGIVLNNHNIFVDSFNSADPKRSFNGAPDLRDSNGHLLTNIGQFDAPNFNVPLSANIATNSKFAAIGNASVYGDVLTNGGATDGNDVTVTNISNVKGQIINDYYEPIDPIYAPQWDSLSYTLGMRVLNGNGNGSRMTTVVTKSPVAPITGGSKSNPTRIKVDSIKLNGGGDQIIFAPGTVDPDDGYSYVELYVTGDFSTAGGGTSDGAVIIQPNVKVTMYVAGNLDFSGNGLNNNNNLASAFSIYGISPTDGTNQTFTLAGNSDFYGTVYAPGADLKLAGGGSSGEFVGSFVGRSATLNGTTQIRYDEALAGTGRISSFKIAGWFEDVKKIRPFPGSPDDPAQLQF